MSDLRLHPLTCPQCGAPGVVREGTRITECARCGAHLCLTETGSARYEAEAELSAAEAINTARDRLDARGPGGMLGRPELVLIPYHEISGRRLGVFERKVPERRRVHRTIHSSQAGGPDVESRWVYFEKEDTKVMVSDVQHIAPAARTRWDLSAFDANEARKAARLRSFDLVEAQRRATVYSEERAPAAADLRFADNVTATLVATSRRTLFFPFWAIPVQQASGTYEIVVDAVRGGIVAWRLPHAYRTASLNWVLLAVPGALGLGQFLRRTLFGGSTIDPFIALLAGAIALGAALWLSNRPDWTVKTWPGPESIG